MEFILAVVGLLALIWGGLLFRETGLIGGCLLVLLTGSCFGYFFYRVDAGPLPLTTDRVLLMLLAAAWLAAKKLGGARDLAVDRSDLLIVLFAVVLLASTFSHDWRSNEMRSVAQLLFFFLMPVGLYWIAREAPASDRALVAVFACFALFGLYLSVTAIGEKFGVAALVHPRFIASPQFPEFLGRARGPYLNPSANGVFLAAGVAAAMLWYRWLPPTGQLALLAVTPLYAAGVYCTMTRCVWLAAVATVLVCGGLTAPKAWRVPLFGAVLLLGVGTAASQWDRLKAFKRDKHVSVGDMQKSASLRPVLAQVAWRMFRDRPLFGCGFGRYEEECRDYLSERGHNLSLDSARGYEQHNVVLALLTETGLAGAGSFVLALFCWSGQAWRLWTNGDATPAQRQQGLFFLAWLPGYLAIGMLQAISIAPMVNMLLFFMAGFTRGVAAQAGATSATRQAEAAPGGVRCPRPA